METNLPRTALPLLKQILKIFRDSTEKSLIGKIHELGGNIDLLDRKGIRINYKERIRIESC